MFDCGQIGHAQERVRFGESGVKRMSAYEGKADVRELPSGCLLIARSGHLVAQFPLDCPMLWIGCQKARLTDFEVDPVQH